MTTNSDLKQTFGLRFGAMVNSIKQQLKEQGLTMNEQDLKHFQLDADAIARVRIRLSLSDGETKRLQQRLIKNIAKKVTDDNR
jgi:hypothetical protein